ncbi:unnamed protein product [Ambrosiozyma monospora]|uniref:Dynactin subunit 5 n=1 Tax=Ambrosiozyma monospora TaxID=43982 RepID=A0A9W6YU19_AMBMO|nr:unnamed protein product [Ambrosiozyma monospora]
MSDPNWVETASGNRIHRTSRISGKKHIIIGGQTTIESHCKLSASTENQCSLSIGKCCYFNTGVELNAVSKHPKGIKIGPYCFIDKNTKVEDGVTIGNRVRIGAGCRIGKGAILHDCCVVEDGVHLFNGFVVAPFSIVRNKGKNVDDDDDDDDDDNDDNDGDTFDVLEVEELDPSVKICNEEFVKHKLLLG